MQTTFLVLSALGPDHPGIVDELSRYVLDAGCNIGESRMTVLGTEFALFMMLTGSWNAIAKLENILPRIEESLDLVIHTKRSKPREDSSNSLPYGVEVVSINRPDIVNLVSNFFSRRNINIEDIYTSAYPAPHTLAPMFSLHMTVGIPADMSIAEVRGAFMDFCDDHNLDAALSPMK